MPSGATVSPRRIRPSRCAGYPDGHDAPTIDRKDVGKVLRLSFPLEARLRKSRPAALEDQWALTISSRRHAGHPRHASRLHDASPSRQHRPTKHPSASCQPRSKRRYPPIGGAPLPRPGVLRTFQNHISPRQYSRGAGRSHCAPALRNPLLTTSTLVLFRLLNWSLSRNSNESSLIARQVSRIPPAEEHQVGPGPTPEEPLAAGAKLQDRGNPGNVTAETI